MSQAPWLAIFPGIAVMLIAKAFNRLEDAIRDALDRRSPVGIV